MADILVAALIQSVGDYYAGFGVHLAEYAAAVGIVHIPPAVAHAQPRAEHLKPFAGNKGDDPQGV